MLVYFNFLVLGEPKKYIGLWLASLQPLLHTLQMLPVLYVAFQGFLRSLHQDKASGPLVTFPRNKY